MSWRSRRRGRCFWPLVFLPFVRSFETWHLVDVSAAICTESLSGGTSGSNLATGATVTCDPALDNCGATLVDGDSSCSSWSASPLGVSASCAHEDQAWVQVELAGGESQFNQVQLWAYTCAGLSPRRVCGRRIQVSTDGTTWTTVIDNGGYDGDEGPDGITFSFETVSASFVRVWSGRNNQNTQVSFMELAIYNAGISPPPPYAVQIPIDHNQMDPDMPHIISVIRQSPDPVTVGFTVRDATGTVVASETISLNDQGSQPNGDGSSCSCTGESLPAGLHGTYGIEYGTYCSDWDYTGCDDLWGADFVGPMCCQRWCYVDAVCEDAYISELADGLYYSYYGACAQPSSSCSWTAQDECACQHVGHIMDGDMVAKFPPEYGSSCAAWDEMDAHPCEDNYDPADLDSWCCSQWCYVNRTCATSIPSLNMPSDLFWSSSVCYNDPVYVAQCPYQGAVNATGENVDLCACINAPMPSMWLPSGAPADYGLECGAHDAQYCNTWFPNVDHGIWCCQSWCYVGARCPDAHASSVWPGAFWSYLGCEQDATALRDCAHSDACTCKTVAELGITFDSDNPNYGTTCSPWDSVNCHAELGSTDMWLDDGLNDWCCKSWCFTGRRDQEECPVSTPHALEPNLSMSYHMCEVSSEATQVHQLSTDECVELPEDPCNCTGEIMPSNLLPAGAPADYGSECGTHDATDCGTWYADSADRGLWCCRSWCWVSELCPLRVESELWPGHYYVDADGTNNTECQMDVDAIMGCSSAPNPHPCACTGNNSGIDLARFPPDYGTSCAAWDSTNPNGTCYDIWGPSSPVPLWEDGESNDWCCAPWCYVTEECPLVEDAVDGAGARLPYSYDSCGTDFIYYDATTHTCSSRRLQGEEELSHLDDERPPRPTPQGPVKAQPRRKRSEPWRRRSSSSTVADAAQPMKPAAHEKPQAGAGAGRSLLSRRMRGYDDDIFDAEDFIYEELSAPPRRGKGGGGGGGSYSGWGGGKSYNAYYDSRRRAPSRPANPENSRRRATSGPVRRRGASDPAVSTRRRTTSLDGTRYTTSSGNAYGYTDKAQLSNSYGGQMPHTTTYGYSGAIAGSAGSTRQISMYNSQRSGGNAVLFGGVAAGAGSYWWWYSYHGSHAEYFRRRRTAGDVEWCVVPSAGGNQEGEFMECDRCRSAYGACEPSGHCYAASGCGYFNPSEVVRDDLMGVGFVPADYVGPLNVTIDVLTGTGFEASSVCPVVPATEASVNTLESSGMMSFRADLYFTLTQMDELGSGTSDDPNCRRNTGYDCKAGYEPGSTGTGPCYGAEEVCMEDYVCWCKTGTCLEGSGASAVCHPSRTTRSSSAPSRIHWMFTVALLATASRQQTA